MEPGPESRLYDVAVVGGGPVGSILSILLARAGHSVLVLERHHKAYPRARAVVFDDEIARVLAAAGAEEVIADSEPALAYEWRNATGKTLLRFDFPLEGRSGWATNNSFDQPTMERVLAQRMSELSLITVARGQQVTGVVQGDDETSLVSREVDGEDHTWRASYVVGADGANSFVRSRMSTTMHDLGFIFDWLIVDVVLSGSRVFDPDNLQICDPARPTTAVSSGPGRRRWEFMRRPEETLEELNRPTTAWQLLAPFDVTPENARLERHVVYKFSAQWADEWRDGRLLLAGDAAHLMPPFAGQGLCSGIRDAANLAWKLSSVLKGTSPATLLDTYTSERSAHVQHAIQTSIALGAVICETDPDAIAERDRVMLAGGGDPAKVLPPVPPARLVDGLLHRVGGATDPTAGVLSLQGHVLGPDGPGRFDQVVGTGFVLICTVDPRSALGEHRMAVLRRFGAHLVQVVPAPASLPMPTDLTVVADTDDVYLPYLRELGATGVVVRPDFYVFGTAATADDLAGLLDDLFRQLTPVPQGARA